MPKIVLFLITIVCLFGPMILFAVIGNKALTALGKRPSEGAGTMIPFLIKVIGASLGSVVILAVMLKFFGPGSGDAPALHFTDFDWHLSQ